MAQLRMWWLTLAWAVLIVALTVAPMPDTGASLGVPGLDKLVHAALFGVLAWLALQARARGGARRPALWLLLVAIAVFAGADEWVQQFIAGRSADLLDWVADMTGMLSAVLILASAPLRREMTS